MRRTPTWVGPGKARVGPGSAPYASSSLAPMEYLGDDLLAWMVAALGGALAVGTLLALTRPPAESQEGDLERPPLARSLVMIALGGTAAVWALVSLVAG